MKSLTIRTVVVSILLLNLSFSLLNAQITNTDKVRFGKISDAEIELTNYAPDPEAEAVVLFDKGQLRMDLDPDTYSFEYLLERHIRIKIMKASSTDGKARYSLRFVDLDNSIQVIEKFTVNEPFFSTEEYAALKNSLDLVMENQQATLVIKGK